MNDLTILHQRIRELELECEQLREQRDEARLRVAEVQMQRLLEREGVVVVDAQQPRRPHLEVVR